MADFDWFIAGLIVGFLCGVSIAASILAFLSPRESGSVVFDRDEQGRITGIHYVPRGVKR